MQLAKSAPSQAADMKTSKRPCSAENELYYSRVPNFPGIHAWFNAAKVAMRCLGLILQPAFSISKVRTVATFGGRQAAALVDHRQHRPL